MTSTYGGALHRLLLFHEKTFFPTSNVAGSQVSLPPCEARTLMTSTYGGALHRLLLVHEKTFFPTSNGYGLNL